MLKKPPSLRQVDVELFEIMPKFHILQVKGETTLNSNKCMAFKFPARRHFGYYNV